jgi:hypothetical protein
VKAAKTPQGLILAAYQNSGTRDRAVLGWLDRETGKYSSQAQMQLFSARQMA